MDTAPPPFAAALLIGGRSRRMGEDKAMLPWQGRPLWLAQLDKLRALQPTALMIAARADQALGQPLPSDCRLILDPPDQDLGPLPAIARCLRLAQQPLLALAVDMPRLSADFLREHLLKPQAEALGLCFEGEPLAALYTPAMLPLMEEALSTGQLGLQKLWAAAAQQGLAKLMPLTPAQRTYFANMNTPDERQAIQRAEACEVEANLRAHEPDAAVVIQRMELSDTSEREDFVAREEPLEIRVEGRSVAVVMRTPGHDRELAAGFLVSEGVVQRPRDVMEISQCPAVAGSKGNIVDVLLAGAQVDWQSLTRHVFSASSCGLCGKTSIDSVFQRFPPVTAGWSVSPELLSSLPGKLRAAQATFDRTGGLHACALFDLKGDLIVLREDVGRHNALDKVLGYGLLNGLLPYREHVLLLSGRVSFEMIQKALAGGIALVAAISAPSSLAVDFAREAGQTLVGFLRGSSMNVYGHPERVLAARP